MNRYREAWEKLEAPDSRPAYARNIVEADYAEFADRVVAQEPRFVNDVVESLYAGDIYLLKRGFSREFMHDLLEKVHSIWSLSPSSFHKMIEGCPDFHRMQDEEVAKKYVFESVRHSYYWFHWNGDPMGVIPDIMKRWRVFKFLGGYRPDEYEKNTPKDGVVDRFQVARYLPGIGRSETHSDPYQNQKFFISAFMSKRGTDYEKGGFYVIGPDNRFVDLEDRIDVGDIGIGFATVMHGVDRIGPHKKPDWTAKDGRWWLGLYSNSTDYVKDRATGRPTRIALKTE